MINSISRKDTANNTSAIAVASAYLYCSSFVMIKIGAICVLFGMFPAMKTTLPYSPIPANAGPEPASSDGKSSGSTTQKNV